MSHVFLPVYLDAEKKVLDNSTNAVTTLDSSFNFIMTTIHASANNLKQFLKFKKNGSDYTYKFNESYKILFEDEMSKDISSSVIELYDCSFNSGINPEKCSMGRMFIRYMADTLLGHPFAQAIIVNEKEIIDKTNESNLHKQFTFVVSDGLQTSSFASHTICDSLLDQFLNNSPERFNDVSDNIEYNFPFHSNDFITLFVKMNGDINLNDRSTLLGTPKQTNYNLLKNMFSSKSGILFDDANNLVKFQQSIWRIKIKLI